MSEEGYAGEVTPKEAWEALEKEPDSVLIDVRTRAEWTYVGVPDLGSIGKDALLVEWQSFPSGEINPNFAKQVIGADLNPETKIYFLCRSGQRSRAAAIAMTAHGFVNCYNVTTGFEGGHDEEGHRGRKEGWKADGLPWGQN